EGWKRRDWDGQKLLELFHEFGFRSFAERVRKTHASSGAKKNAEVLATIGEARRAGGISPPSSTKVKPKARGADAPRSPGLFDEIMEVPQAAEPKAEV